MPAWLESAAPSVRAGRPIRWAPTAMATASTSPCSPRTRKRIELCLFDADGAREFARHACPATATTSGTATCRGAGRRAWSTACAHTGPGGPSDGHRFNPHKLLLDPYAREIVGRFDWRDAALRRRRSSARPAGHRATTRAHSVEGARRRRPLRLARRPTACTRRWTDTVLYELHVKGFTMLHPGVPEAQRGTLCRPGSATPPSRTCSGWA